MRYGKHKNISFSFHKGSAKKMIVFFHGSIRAKLGSGSKTVLPVFYGQGKEDKLKNAHILKFSDFLLEHYSDAELELSWFLDTSTIKQQDSIVEIINYHKNTHQIDEIIFYGSSGGGYIALLLACRLREVAVFTNSQFILNMHSQFSDLEKILKLDGNSLIEIDLFKNLSLFHGPKYIHNFCNISDYTYIHHQHAEECIKKLFPDSIKSYYFDGSKFALARSARNHDVRFPNDMNPEDILINLL
jgi:hypothetical protein